MGKKRDRRNAGRAGFKDLMEVRERHSSESQHRDSHAASYDSKCADSNRRAVLKLARRFEHGSKHDEIRAIAFRILGLLETVRRNTDKNVGPVHGSHRFNG